MATATDTRLQAKTISPTLTVNNIQQSIKFFDSILVIRKADGERRVPVSTYTEDPDTPPQQ